MPDRRKGPADKSRVVMLLSSAGETAVCAGTPMRTANDSLDATTTPAALTCSSTMVWAPGLSMCTVADHCPWASTGTEANRAVPERTRTLCPRAASPVSVMAPGAIVAPAIGEINTGRASVASTVKTAMRVALGSGGGVAGG